MTIETESPVQHPCRNMLTSTNRVVLGGLGWVGLGWVGLGWVDDDHKYPPSRVPINNERYSIV